MEKIDTLMPHHFEISPVRTGCGIGRTFPGPNLFKQPDVALRIGRIPAANHRKTLLKLYSVLFWKLEYEGLGVVLASPRRVVLSPLDIVNPDIVFIRKNRTGIVAEGVVLGPPDLAVEIVTGGALKRDLNHKRKLYADSGVSEFWAVNPVTESIEQYLWSELGYISAGILHKQDALTSRLFAHSILPVSEIF